MTSSPDPADASTGARWLRVKELFHAAADAPPEERPKILGELAGDDRELVEEVESLLEHCDDHSPLLETPVVTRFVSDIVPGKEMGAYRIVREIGRGGMGTVYLAERADGAYQRQVALKLIRRGIDTEVVLRRFENERHILARLDHPNIARLLDAGTTAAGRPWFVMEYVDGLAIDDYCERHELSVDDVVRLFVQVCQAVDSAHRHLVIHRDLKPANIVVTRDGVPKLLDFGIARMLDATDGQLTATVAEQRMLTPEYASPEQLLGEPVGVASDVYSLGVVLYELLTGVRPHHRPSGEMPLRALQAEPERPSTAAARRGTAGEVERRRRRLKGDLDNIVLMALRADTRRRYASARDLADDLQRFLEGRVVVARADSVSYRARKYLRRHRAGVVALVLVGVSLVGGLVATARQAAIAERERQRAERRYADVRRLTNTLLTDLQADLQKLPGGIAVQQETASTVLRYLDRLDAETGSDPTLKLDLATAFRQAGSLAFDMARAREAYQKSIALASSLVESDPSCSNCRSVLVMTLIDLADLLKMMGETDAALRQAVRARDEATILVRKSPASPEYRLLHEQTHSLTGFVLEDAGDHAAALVEYRRAAALAQALGQRWPRDPSMVRRSALALTHLGINLAAIGRTEEAIVQLRAALQAAQQQAERYPLDVRIRRDHWQAQLHLGDVLARSGQREEGLQHLRAALATKNWLHEADPGDTGHQRGLAITKSRLADALVATGATLSAWSYYESARLMTQRLVESDPLNCESAVDLGAIQRRAAGLLALRGEMHEARERLESGSALLRRCAHSPRNFRARQELAWSEAAARALHARPSR